MRILLPHSPAGSRLKPSRLRLILALGLFAAQVGAGFCQTRLERPIMMDGDGPDLFVLDSAGTLHEFEVAQDSLTEYGRIFLPSTVTPADMAYAASGGQRSVLIAGSQMGRGLVTMYSLDGRSVRTWNFRNICSGIDFGPKSHTAYVAMSDSNEIYRLDTQGTESTYVSRIPNATKLGPLAFDEANQIIYVADVAVGAIYQYSIATKSTTVLVSDLSAPTAVSYDPEAGRLYVADPGRRGIFIVDVRSSKPVATGFVSAPLKSPYGMALVPNARLAVADYGANSIVIFSDRGALLFRFPSAN
jgi:DNA-binding beta-propeller fold protein YncE